jgi:hypothetical protein
VCNVGHFWNEKSRNILSRVDGYKALRHFFSHNDSHFSMNLTLHLCQLGWKSSGFLDDDAILFDPKTRRLQFIVQISEKDKWFPCVCVGKE